MKHEQKHFEIKNVVLLPSTNAQKSCTKKEGVTLYKLWLAAKKDTLRVVLEDAFRPNEINNKDVFEFCGVKPANNKVINRLRLCQYENPEDYVTFEMISWNKPFECAVVRDFNELVFQEFTVTCDLTFKSIDALDEDGHCKYNSKGQKMKTDAGCFNASNVFCISDLDLEDTFDE